MIRYTDLAPKQSERLWIATTVEDGEPVEPVRMENSEWLAITLITEPGESDCYVLNFLSRDGRRLDWAERHSLHDALAEVGAVVGEGQWRECWRVLAEPWGRIPRDAIA